MGGNDCFGGTLDIISKIGQGSSFIIRLPLECQHIRCALSRSRFVSQELRLTPVPACTKPIDQELL